MSNLCVTQSGGDSLIHYPPFFSLDARFLLCACASEIKVFSTETGENTRRLIGHKSEVTGIAHHPKIKLQILSCSLDCTIKIWDYEDGVLLKTCEIGCPLDGLYSHQNIQSVLLITKQNDEANLCKLLLKEIEENSEHAHNEISVLATGVDNKIPRAVGFLSSGNIVVFCKKRNLCVLDINNPENIIEHKDKKGGEITCIACHPTDNCCVTGHINGIIKFWHNLHPTDMKIIDKKLAKSAVVVSSQHWHSGAVKDVSFTPGGSSLLSIGKESVLVQWQYLESGGKKDFFPRLGMSALHITISNDGMLYATTHIDNSVLLITNYFTIKHSLEGFTAVAQISKNAAAKSLEYDWKTASCVTNGKPGHLLFYHPYTDIQLYNLDIVHQNYIAAEIGSDLPQTVITNVAFSCQNYSKSEQESDLVESTWMATVEEIPAASFSREQKLKFWIFDEAEQWWKLNTIVNDPHKSTVTKIIFRPYSSVGELNPALLTTSLDGMAKIWTVKQNSTSESLFWSCVTAASYRSQPVYGGGFSQDGSLVATAFGNTVCLSDPEMLQELAVLLSFSKEENIKQLVFGKFSCQHILMVVLQDAMHACDLLSGGILWSVDTKINHLVCDPLSNFMAAFTDNDDLFVFQPTSSMPLYTHKGLCDNPIVNAAFVPNTHARQKSWIEHNSDVEWMQHSRIFFIDSKMSVFTVCTDAEIENKIKSSTMSNNLMVNTESLKTPLASVLQKSHSEKDTNLEDALPASDITHSAQLDALRQIIDVPCHVAPPISTLCQSFLSSLLPKKATSEGSTWKVGNTGAETKNLKKEKEIVIGKFTDMSILDNINEQTFAWAAHLFDN